ncbi:MAG: hypothetical protein HRT46_06085 [Deltaproteobacteria bacterium]|nr:hypothetical protein [Deltaproteobacteria bacterium]
MLQGLFPHQVNNDYRGHPLALWLFYPITLITVGRSLVHVFRADGGAQSIATIPLDSYSVEAAAAVVTIFALWGVSQVLIGLLYVLVLWRYRVLLPLMYLSLIVEYLSRMAISNWKPIVTLETPPAVPGGYLIIVVSLVMLVLSLRRTPAADG